MFTLPIRFLLCFFLITASGTVFCQPSPATADSPQQGRTPEETVADDDDAVIDDSVYLPSADRAVYYEPRNVPEEQVRRYQRDPVFAYANDPAYWKKDPPPANPGWLFNLFASKVTQVIFSILFLLVLGYGIYRLVKENAFGMLRIRRKKTQQQLSPAEPAEEQSLADLEKAIRQHVADGDYSKAVRLMYICLIRTAVEKDIIRFSAASTNSQIVEAFRDPGQARDFRFLATAYDHVVYGGFTPGAEQFRVLQEKFNAFHKHWEN